MEVVDLRGIRKTDRNTRRFIRIADINMWEMIDRLMGLEEYSKSFNKVINHALFIGLPLLVQNHFGIEEQEVQNEPTDSTFEEDCVEQIIRLLKEIVLNETINKSILCSLFNLKTQDESLGLKTKEKLEKGGFRDTPEYLTIYELKGLKDLRK